MELFFVQAVSYSSSRFSITGLISLPTAESCHWTREMQYLFLNQRWLRAVDVVGSTIDRIYRRVLIAKRAGAVT